MNRLGDCIDCVARNALMYDLSFDEFLSLTFSIRNLDTLNRLKKFGRVYKYFSVKGGGIIVYSP